MNLFKLIDFVKTLEPGDDVQILCSRPNVAQFLVNGKAHSSMEITENAIMVGPFDEYR